MMHSIKPGVRLTGITPQIAVAWSTACDVYRTLGYACVMTSAVEGRHRRASLHYVGAAMDLRTRHVPEAQREPLAHALREALGPEYDVVLESDHIHVEWQPKGSLVSG